MTWEIKTIKDLGKVVTGKTPSKEVSDYYENGELLFISPKDLDWNSYFVFDSQTKVTEKAYFSQKNQIVPRNAIFYTSLSFAIGKMGIASQDSLTNQQIHSIVVNDKNNFKFVYYLLQSYRPYIFSYNSGIDTPIVPKSTFEKIKINLPSLDIQTKIAGILSAYDELIENNKKRIALLETMAEELYKEWFVRFRFPNYENTEFEKGVPKEWKIVQLKDIAFESSKPTKAGEHLQGRYYLPLDVMSSRKFTPTNHYEYTEAHSSLVTFEKGDFIFGAMRPYQHKVNVAPFNGVTRTTCFVIKPKIEEYYSFLYLTLFQKSTVDYAMLISNGADRPYAVWNKGFEKLEILLPTEELIEKYNEFTKPIIDFIINLYFLNLKLENKKNQLLPRLISGKLSVEHLNIQQPPTPAQPTDNE